jgi:hypothetical protein
LIFIFLRNYRFRRRAVAGRLVNFPAFRVLRSVVFNGFFVLDWRENHAGTIPALTAPAVTLGIDNAGATATATLIFHKASCFFISL